VRRMFAIGALCLTAFARANESPDMAAMNDVMQMNDAATFGMISFDQLEHAIAPGNPLAWEADAWYGGDFDKIWLRSEGEREDGRLDARNELFWDHAFSSFWDWQIGARHDSGLGADRDWAALGVRGQAPYGFNVEATAYVGADGRTSLRFRTEYEILLTQRLVLQPELETNLYGKNDPRRDVAAGLSDAEFGLRLRYEIRRELAPYVGVVCRHRFGDGTRLARLDGYDADDVELVAGIRFWF
jgi:copper resistance protein B